MKKRLKHYGSIIISVVVFNILIGISISYISHSFFGGILSTNGIKWESIFEEIVVVGVFAPFIETFLFQTLTYKFFKYVTKDNQMLQKKQNLLFIFLSSIFFAYFHQYNWLYFLNALLGGLSLNACYIYFKNRSFFPYLSVVVIHLLYNGFVLIFNHYIST